MWKGVGGFQVQKEMHKSYLYIETVGGKNIKKAESISSFYGLEKFI